MFPLPYSPVKEPISSHLLQTSMREPMSTPPSFPDHALRWSDLAKMHFTLHTLLIFYELFYFPAIFKKNIKYFS